MLLVDAEKLALELMAQFGLGSNWTFEFDNARSRFGCCRRKLRYIGTGRRETIGGRITLSRELVLRNDREQVEDTIRHEIAHAKCEPKEGHGSAWKAMCKVVGANPERCYDDEEVNAVEGDWQATCGICGTRYNKFRRPKGTYRCNSDSCTSNYRSGRWAVKPVLVFRHKNEIVPVTVPTPRAAIEAMKAQLRREEGLEQPSLIYQCAKCDRKSISFHSVCPVCNGDMVEEKKLAAEKEALKKRIKELESKR
jgi:predicted SprT family Zn-dependent metalloprotease